jgi:hypothetical protein
MIKLLGDNRMDKQTKTFKVWIEIIECQTKEEMVEYFHIMPDFIRYINEWISKNYEKTNSTQYKCGFIQNL